VPCDVGTAAAASHSRVRIAYHQPVWQYDGGVYSIVLACVRGAVARGGIYRADLDAAGARLEMERRGGQRVMLIPIIALALGVIPCTTAAITTAATGFLRHYI
jgi:hypothetical protein